MNRNYLCPQSSKETFYKQYLMGIQFYGSMDGTMKHVDSITSYMKEYVKAVKLIKVFKQIKTKQMTTNAIFNMHTPVLGSNSYVIMHYKGY